MAPIFPFFFWFLQDSLQQLTVKKLTKTLTFPEAIFFIKRNRRSKKKYKSKLIFYSEMNFFIKRNQKSKKKKKKKYKSKLLFYSELEGSYSEPSLDFPENFK